MSKSSAVSSLAVASFAWAAFSGAARAEPSTNAPVAPETNARRVIYIQPMGRCGKTDPSWKLVQRSLRAFYGVEVRELPCVDLPKQAFYPPRRRYRAERLLDFLAARLPADGWRILGLTSVDISTTKGQFTDWGIFGLGELPGTASVISSFRLGKGARDERQVGERVAKVAVHEIGHTLGLDHCPMRSCLMEDAQAKVKTVDRENDLCPVCRRRLRAAGLAIPDEPEIPWRTPER
jgi:archaemetzincin